MVGMLLLVIVLNRIGAKDSSILSKLKNSGEGARARKAQALVANVVSGMGRTSACARVVQCNVRVGGRSVR